MCSTLSDIFSNEKLLFCSACKVLKMKKKIGRTAYFLNFVQFRLRSSVLKLDQLLHVLCVNVK